jgi:hypothetical protein
MTSKLKSVKSLGEDVYSNVTRYYFSSTQQTHSQCEEKDKVPKGRMVMI